MQRQELAQAVERILLLRFLETRANWDETYFSVLAGSATTSSVFRVNSETGSNLLFGLVHYCFPIIRFAH
jgi:hypothetical protein